MRDDRSSFIRNAKESSTELDALAASVRGDGMNKKGKDWSSEFRARDGAQSPEEQYGRFRPMSQSQTQPFLATAPMPAPGFANAPPYGARAPASRGVSPTRVAVPGVRGPRDYEGYSNAYGIRSESPVPPPSRGNNGGDIWKRGVGYD